MGVEYIKVSKFAHSQRLSPTTSSTHTNKVKLHTWICPAWDHFNSSLATGQNTHLLPQKQPFGMLALWHTPNSNQPKLSLVSESSPYPLKIRHAFPARLQAKELCSQTHFLSLPLQWIQVRHISAWELVLWDDAKHSNLLITSFT